MKILVNCSTLKKGGVLQVANSFVSEISKRSDHEYHIIFSSGLMKDFEDFEFKENISVYRYDVKPSVFLSLTGKERGLDALLADIQPDVVFTVFAPSYWKPGRPHIGGYAKASYLYTESPFIVNMPLLAKLRLTILKKLHFFDFKHFNLALITENEDISQRLREVFPRKKVYTISNTYNQIFDHMESWDKSVQLPEFKGVTLLTISANYKHKNLNVIPQVINYLNLRYPSFSFRFVLTLREEELLPLNEMQREHVVFLDRVSLNSCPYLYQQADLMFMPTLLECFSATYPEAMKMDVPVLTSDLPFARGICGDAAIYFDPLAPASIGEEIFRVAKDDKLYYDMVSKGRIRLSTFETAQSRAQKYIDILEGVHESN